jgi:hypothetical protein
MAIAVSDATALAKEYYASGGLFNAAYEENPGLGVSKKIKITGKHYDFPLQYGYGSNRSRTAATTLNKVNGLQDIEFNVTTARSFDAKDIETQALDEVTDEGAFVDLLTNVMDSLGKSLGNGLGEDLFLNTGAARGVVGLLSTVNLTLANTSHVTRFEVGQEIKAATTDGTSGSVLAGSATITAITRDTGVLTSDSAWDAQITTPIAAGHFLFVDGEFGLGRAGLPSWIPDATTGLGSAFFGATRSVDATRLAGNREIVNAGSDIVSSLRTLMARMGREEAMMDCALCSFEMLGDIDTQVEQKVMIDVKANGIDMGFDAVDVRVAGRKVTFIPDRSCGDDRIYVGNKADLELVHSTDKPFDIEDKDGAILARNATGFSYDVRGLSLSNYVVRKPKNWGVLIFE